MGTVTCSAKYDSRKATPKKSTTTPTRTIVLPSENQAQIAFPRGRGGETGTPVAASEEAAASVTGGKPPPTPPLRTGWRAGAKGVDSAAGVTSGAAGGAAGGGTSGTTDGCTAGAASSCSLMPARPAAASSAAMRLSSCSTRACSVAASSGAPPLAAIDELRGVSRCHAAPTKVPTTAPTTSPEKPWA